MGIPVVWAKQIQQGPFSLSLRFRAEVIPKRGRPILSGHRGPIVTLIIQSPFLRVREGSSPNVVSCLNVGKVSSSKARLLHRRCGRSLSIRSWSKGARNVWRGCCRAFSSEVARGQEAILIRGLYRLSLLALLGGATKTIGPVEGGITIRFGAIVAFRRGGPRAVVLSSGSSHVSLSHFSKRIVVKSKASFFAAVSTDASFLLAVSWWTESWLWTHINLIPKMSK